MAGVVARLNAALAGRGPGIPGPDAAGAAALAGVRVVAITDVLVQVSHWTADVGRNSG